MKVRAIILLTGLLWLLGACQQRPEQQLTIKPVPLPEGGDVIALAHAQGTGVMALSASSLHLKTKAGWTPYPIALPMELNTTTPWIASRHLMSSTGGAQRFVAHNNTFWLLTTREGRPALLHHRPGEETWHVATLPQTRVIKTSRDVEPLLAPNPRLLASGEQLYLIESQGLWRVNRTKEQVRFEAVSLKGIVQSETSIKSSLPFTLRHYIPATKARPYELLSVLSDQLHIYTKHKETSRWVMVSSLATLDQFITATATRPDFWLVGPKSLYQSQDMAERWTQRPLPLMEPRETITAMVSFTNKAQEAVLLGTSTGALYLSNDQDRVWKKTRQPDTGARGIRDIYVDRDTNAIWVATAGQGVVQSQDGGQTWASQNSGLRATQPHVMALGLDDALLLGTNAGLFSLTKLQDPTTWSRLIGDNTTALTLNRQTQTTIAGTNTGQIVLMGSDAQPKSYSPDYNTIINAATFEPGMSWQRRSSPESVLGFMRAPGKTLFMTHQKGLFSFGQDVTFYHQTSARNAVLEEALKGSRITSMLHHSETLLMTTQGYDAETPIEFWRSKDAGTTWQSRFGVSQTRPDLTTRLFIKDKLPHVLHQGGLYQLAPKTIQLQAIAMPWDKAQTLLAYHSNAQGYDLALVQNSRGFKLYQLSKQNQQLIRSFSLNWDDSEMTMRGHTWSLQQDGNTIFIKNNDGLYRVNLRRSEEEQDRSMAIIFSTFAILLMATTGFAMLKIYG